MSSGTTTSYFFPPFLIIAGGHRRESSGESYFFTKSLHPQRVPWLEIFRHDDFQLILPISASRACRPGLLNISFRLLSFVGEADTHGVSRAGTLWDGLSWPDWHKVTVQTTPEPLCTECAAASGRYES